MTKPGSTRSVKLKDELSLRPSRGVAKPYASFPSGKPTAAKRGATVTISMAEAGSTKVDWAKVATTTDADIGRHARSDGSQPPSARQWQKMVREGVVRAVPPAVVDVRAIRKGMELSQSEFAARFGFTTSAVRQWEQGRRKPHGPARALLTIIAREPNAVLRALSSVA